MATTVADLHTRLAYRLGENTTPNDTNEKAKRLSFFNEVNRKVIGEHYWWFLRTIGATHTVSGQEIYTLPTYFRDMVELRIDNKVYAPINDKEAFGSYRYPPSDYYYGTNSPRYYVYNDELHIIPVVNSAPSALTVTATSSSTTATFTTTADHGFTVNTWVTIAGANEAPYNGTFRVQSIPSSTTFTVTMAATTTTPATGTITCTEQNLVYRYWSKVTPLTSDASTIQIPDDYSDLYVAWAYMRKQQFMGRRGSASDGSEEYNQLVRDLTAEENRRKFKNKSYQPPYGEYV